jgi:hypothetical protein
VSNCEIDSVEEIPNPDVKTDDWAAPSKNPPEITMI